MSDTHKEALSAARALAQLIALKSTQGSVLVWEDEGEKKIVVCARKDWVSRHDVPRDFRGYRVEVQDELEGRPH